MSAYGVVPSGKVKNVMLEAGDKSSGPGFGVRLRVVSVSGGSTVIVNVYEKCLFQRFSKEASFLRVAQLF